MSRSGHNRNSTDNNPEALAKVAQTHFYRWHNRQQDRRKREKEGALYGEKLHTLGRASRLMELSKNWLTKDVT
jgi:hypothetical protein